MDMPLRAAQPVTARLWVREPSGRIHEHRLALDGGEDGAAIVIGRDATAAIALADPAVSRFHARLERHGSRWRIRDLGSSNQTFVNGDPVTEWTLAAGDVIGIGDCELHVVEEVQRVASEPGQTQVLARLDPGEPVAEGMAPTARAATVLGWLYQLSRELPAQTTRAGLLELAVRLLAAALPADRSAVLLFEGDALLCEAAHARGDQALRGFVLSQTIYRELVQNRTALLSADTTSDARFRDQASVIGEEIRSVIAAPLRRGSGLAGILYLDRLQGAAGPFDEQDLQGAAVAAELIGGLLSGVEARSALVEEREQLVQTILDAQPIIGRSAGIQRVREFIRRAAPADSTVLILGETGTGKELVARAIHYQSPRRGHPFVAINCAAIPESLVESELFGHEKGAFTGAVARKPGKFEAAHRGTVFLDEVGELPLGCQSKLLRLLEERCFERVGGTESIAIDLRIVAATNRDLAADVSTRRFREDLFYRLNVLQVTVPPLSQRRDDLDLLIEHFLDHFARKTATQRRRLAPPARDRLLSYEWPGNVRQLRNALESCVVMAQGDVIELADLPTSLGPGRGTGEGALGAGWQPCSIQELERQHIGRVLDAVGWNKSKAAEILGIERSTLYARIRSHGLRSPEESE